MPTWKELYSINLGRAQALFTALKTEPTAQLSLEQTFLVLKGQIQNDEARAEIEAYEKEVATDYNKQLAKLDEEAQGKSSVLKRKEVYDRIYECDLWKLEEMLKKHQELARQYNLLPGE